MAAPVEKTINDLSGVWIMNTELSDDPDRILKLQQVAYTTRTFISYSTVTLTITQTTGKPYPPADTSENAASVTMITIEQTLSPVRFMPSIKGTVERRCVDGVTRGHEDHIFGRVEGYSKFVSFGEIGDEELEKNWREGEDREKFLVSHVKNLDEGNGWEVTQVWGFQVVDGERRYCRNIKVMKEGEMTLYSRLVYDYKGPVA